MKIVNLKEFINLPIGTVFSKYHPICFDGLMIKNNSILETMDFCYQNLIGNVKADNTDELYENCEKRTMIELDFDCIERDGLFKEEQLFAIYEKHDIDALITALKTG